ncbi:MAG: nitrite reductase large subunit NirB [Acidimicrobiales bacterium]
MTDSQRLLIVGHGMVGHHLVTTLVGSEGAGDWDITVVGEEPQAAYDRVGLSRLFNGASPADLDLVDPALRQHPGLTFLTDERVVTIDRSARTAGTNRGRLLVWDALVLATGSLPFVPPLEGSAAPGCFVYRTPADVAAITKYAAGRRSGVVIGGGLLGLEAAGGLRSIGLDTHVVEFAPRLMPVQLDPEGGAVLRLHIEDLGVEVHTDARARAAVTGAGGAVRALAFEDGTELPCDLIVFSAGIRPRDDLARSCGLTIHERGGVVVDEACRTSDPAIFAVGECAVAAGRIWGLVAPGYQMARVVADRLQGGDATFTGADMSTKLKLLGVDVASIGDPHGTGPDRETVVFRDGTAGIYRRLVLGPPVDGGRRVVGAVLVGDTSAYGAIASVVRGEIEAPTDPVGLIMAPGPTPGAPLVRSERTLVCSCNAITSGVIAAAIREGELESVAEIKACTRAGTGCGACVPVLAELLAEAGVARPCGLCEHFALSRQELFDIIRVRRVATFAEVLATHGSGLGCDICKPAVASMLASAGNGYILDGEQAALQDTNDHHLANLQRDGSYSVVPRVPGGEITPDQLIALGVIAKEFGLYTKITGGQRIDLFGAAVHQLPAIWGRLIDAGMESGHAYGKAVRTVKSCVGSTWCRYGVQDSTTLAIDLELRYRGLRAPHKIKLAVSGCARECAEAQSKDVGVIATERGWNLYVAGNGGLRPRHADLLAEDLDTATLVRYIDRFLMYYVRTADRLERTATWMGRIDGGLDHVRRVVIDDAIGLGADLEADMAAHVAGYRCEWADTLADPVRLEQFRTFVNTDDPGPTPVYITERGQPRPAPKELTVR